MIRETKKISFANSNPEVVSHGERKAEKESDRKAGEICGLLMFIDLYIMQYIKNIHYCMIYLIPSKFRESAN